MLADPTVLQQSLAVAVRLLCDDNQAARSRRFALETAQEIGQETIHFLGAFLLGPVADARQDRFLPQIRRITFHRRDLFAPEAQYPVAIARDKQRRLSQFCRRERASAPSCDQHCDNN